MPARVIVREVNWLGDLVMSLPALRAVRDAYPRAYLAVMVRRELAGLFDGIDWVDEVIGFSFGRRLAGVADRVRLVARLRRGRFDLAVIFPASFGSALIVAIAGIRRRVGWAADGRGVMLTDRAVRRRDSRTHQSNEWLAMVRETLRIETPRGDCALGVASDARAAMREWIARRRRHSDAPLIAIAPIAAYGPAKEWPAERYAALIDMLAEKYRAECVIVGAGGDREACERVARASRAGAIIAAGETTVAELIAMLADCDGFVGNDSGAMHLAAALGIPTVGIFGSTNPIRTGPLGPRVRVIYRAIECSPCLERTCRFGHYNCLKSIEPAETAAALDALGAFAHGGGASRDTEDKQR